ncbi:LOW QUALITY PROTEIN: hypothetical protein PHMEG_00033352, partial [Phytophthora megakarya]
MRRRLPVKRTESQVARRTAARKEESASSSSKRSQPKKAKEQTDPPPDDPNDSESSDSDNDASREGDSDSSDAEGFSSEDDDIGMTTTTTTADGTTIWSCRPYIDYTNLEKFDEKAFRDNRVNWWERFSDMASQGFWSDTMKIRQFRSRMPTAIDWFTQLPKSTRHDWKQMSRRFRKLYIGTTGSYSERYFTMKMTDHETPLQFFYRLNAAAVKAEVRFKSSSKLRESHIRRFIKKLQNDQLKTALEGHRFQSITDLERALRRHEDVWREEGYDSPVPKKPRGAAVKPISPPDGDPVRDGPKNPPEMCVLICIGPERRTQLQDNQQCTNLVQDEIIYPEQLYSEYQRSHDPIPEISEPESQDPLEVPLKPGQRYGWWGNHEHGDMHGVATIHGAVNDSRTRILLDT